MSSQTKIVVLRMKEVIYTCIFVGLGILLILLFIFMFAGKRGGAKNNSDVPTAYIPGIYNASLIVNGSPVDIAVTVDADHINAIHLVQLDESVTTNYPLMEPAFENLANQIIDTQTTEGIQLSENMKYTQTALFNAIESALQKAAAD